MPIFFRRSKRLQMEKSKCYAVLRFKLKKSSEGRFQQTDMLRRTRVRSLLRLIRKTYEFFDRQGFAAARRVDLRA